jgi:predicted alpha/beta-fold hydrolase
VSSGKIQPSSFRSPWWLNGPHLQTLWPQIFSKKPELDFLDERLELPDGDFVDLCWTQNTSGPIVAVFHGLEGSINSPYARGILTAIQRCGWRGVLMHFRSCSKEFNRLNRNYHSGDTGDIAYFLDTLRERFADTPIAAIGYSLGGNALLKYLGEYPDTHRLCSAVAVSVPFLLGVGADRLSIGFSKIYQKHLITRLKKKMKSKYKDRNPGIDLKNLNDWSTFRLFDDHVTAPLHGFRNVDDYYDRSSCRQFLSLIKTPCLIIHSLDDPFMTAAALPNEEELADAVCLELSDKGGHVGFVDGKYPWTSRSWLEQRIPEFLEQYLDNKNDEST